MVQRIALFVASLAAAAVLAVGLAVAGVGPRDTPAAASTATSVATDPAATPQVQVDTVYVAAPQPPKTVVVHKTVAPTGGEHENESEGSGD
jgi:F0F1-type ATP synthase membrane subunit c/vacuolar-type H+-ATPase subunit K